jgi:uncharacterized Ntn-hydrolase superfamily protein
MTYTIVGCCNRTGQLGIGIATYSLAVGMLAPAIISNAGALTSQAFVNLEFRTLGLRLMADGYPADRVVDTLKAIDPQIEFRQIGVVDCFGRAAAFTGNRTRPWTGHKIGPGYVALGNVLAGEVVANAMAAAFEQAADQALDERLVRALEAGRDAGGQMGGKGHLPERSACLLVHGRQPLPILDLRVDLDEDAVTRLRKVHYEFAPFLAFHHLRHIDPEKAPPQEVFVAELAAKRGR